MCQLSASLRVYVFVRRLTIGLIAVLAWPAAAQAHGGHCPVTNSGYGQYGEWIPTAGGCHGVSQGGSGSLGSGSGGSHSGGSHSGGSVTPQGGGSPSSGGAVAPRTAQTLSKHGSAGVKAAGLARATAPTGIGTGGPSSTSRHNHSTGYGHHSGGQARTSGHTGSVGGVASGGASRSVPGSPAAQLAKALTGSSAGVGLGLLLPVILAATILGALTTRILRGRRGTA